MANNSIKIINKDKEGITLLIGRETRKISWDEFKRNMVMEEDKRHCHFTPEFIEKANKVQQLVGEAAATFVLKSHCSDKSQEAMFAYQLGGKFEEIQQLIGCTMGEAMKLVSDAVHSLTTPVRKKETKEEYEARHKRIEEQRAKEKAERDPHRAYTPTATQTLGDLPGMDKLKQMFNTPSGK